MENATKALIMAGTVLISILLISFLVLFLRKGASASAEYHSAMSDAELAKFNAQFEVYDRDNNTYFDVITVANMVYDINKKNENDQQNSIKLYLCSNLYNDNITNSVLPSEKLKKNYFFKGDNSNNDIEDMYSYVKEYTSQSITKNSDGSLKNIKYSYKFKCLEIKYNELTGKVNEIKFSRQNN